MILDTEDRQNMKQEVAFTSKFSKVGQKFDAGDSPSSSKLEGTGLVGRNSKIIPNPEGRSKPNKKAPGHQFKKPEITEDQVDAIYNELMNKIYDDG